MPSFNRRVRGQKEANKMPVPNRRFRIVIAGSRSISNYNYIRETLKSLPPCTIISGGARGVDLLGERAAKELGLPVERFPANWELYGKKAGFIRNDTLLKEGDMLIAFWDGSSPGTADMISKFRRAKKPFHVYFPEMSYNIWDCVGKYDAICVTTNGFVTRKGLAVMGRGNALQAKVMFGSDKFLGAAIKANGHKCQVFQIVKGTALVSFPVKPQVVEYDGTNVVDHAKDKFKIGDQVPGFYAKASSDVIRRSSRGLAKLIRPFGARITGNSLIILDLLPSSSTFTVL